MNKKILTAATTLVFAAVAVAGSTYAWFTLNQTATVEQLDVKVTAGDGLYVSLTGDEGTFSDSIDPSSLLAGFKFIPVTTSDGEIFVDRKGEDVGAANGEGGYVSFDVYLRSKSELPIYLSSASVTSATSSLTLNVPVSEQTGAWAAGEVTYTGGDPAETTTLTTRASNATRFSVLGGTTDKVFDLVDVDGFGERVAPTSSTGNPVADWTWGTGYNRAFEYLKRVSPNDLTGATFAAEPADIVTTIPGEAIVTLETVGGAIFAGKTWLDADWYASKLTVNIWLEGWDADCFDVLFNDTVTINMEFKGQIA
ncbi:MAG: hypothetical protein VB122_07265 [Erysipelotrichales bacterium]|nr:hypothetical protein [Erysipelotrichales bacterium]